MNYNHQRGICSPFYREELQRHCAIGPNLCKEPGFEHTSSNFIAVVSGSLNIRKYTTIKANLPKQIPVPGTVLITRMCTLKTLTKPSEVLLSHFIDKKTGARKVRNVPKVTQPVGRSVSASLSVTSSYENSKR